MLTRLRDALKTIDVDLHDRIVVTPADAFSFREKGLLQAERPRSDGLEPAGIIPMLSDNISRWNRAP